MKWASALAIYFLFWFLSLFIVLPFHGRKSRDVSNGAQISGHDIGAPQAFPVWRVAKQVTLTAALLFGAYYAAYVSGTITRDMLNFFGHPPS